MQQLSLLFIFALVACSLLTKILIKYLPYFGLVDIPSNRRVHKIPTPRGGGLAIATVFIIGFIGFEYLAIGSLDQSSKIVPIFLLVTSVSFLDDIKSLPVFVRLVIHLICANLAIFFFLYPTPLFHHELPLLIDLVVSTIGLVAFLNIFNFLDGIDGITAVESIHLSICILMLCYLKSDIIINANLIMIISTIIFGCSIGFLMFNWHPAKIFIGDVGSIGIGFLIGLCLLLISASSERLFAASAIASLYYLADGGLTILIRLLNKEKIWQPHLKHFFQQAVKNGKTHQQVVSRIILCNFFLMLLAINALYYPAISIMLALLVVMITLINLAK